MKSVVLLVLLSCLLVSCESSTPKQGATGKNGNGERESALQTGIWENAIYADELGQTRDRDYIRNKELIAGSFSTAATPHSPLSVGFFIFGPNSIYLQLFEHAGNTPVKTLTPVSYTVTMQDADGGQHQAKALNYSDRLAFEKTDARTVHEILIKGGKIQFIITNDFTPKTQYQFTIDNARGYDEAYKKLTDH